MTNEQRKLTIGMCTYDDFHGTYMTIQSIRLYHPEVLNDIEFLVIDNNPTGKQGETLKSFITESVPHGRYIPFDEYTGCGVRSKIFEYANTPFVMSLDCHIMLYPNSLKRLIEYYDDNPKCDDLIQGPLLWEQLENELTLKDGKKVINISTHFDMEWRGGMRGRWSNHPTLGYNVDDPPFEIPSQGLGLFSARKESWLGFNEHFREFGGEEGYIHEKYRRNGRKTLCLPFLRWMHRFYRPEGAPYPISLRAKLKNYVIGHMELGEAMDEFILHFTDEDNKEKNTDDFLRELIIETMNETGYLPKFKNREIMERVNPYTRKVHT